MADRKKYRGIALSAVPYTIEYLSTLAERFRNEGYDGICLICGELFPWSSPSKISAVLYYSEQEIAGFAAFCKKKGIECAAAIDTGDLPAILYSLKGYEKFCVMKEDDQSVFTGKMLPDLVEDIYSLLTDASVFVFGEEVNKLKNIDSETVILSGSENSGDYVIRKNDIFLIETWKAFSGNAVREGRILYPASMSTEENAAEAEYRKLCRHFSVLAEKIMTADSHSRTGCSYPLSFWKGCMDMVYRLENDISVSFEKLYGLVKNYINSCWLESWVYSRNRYYRENAAEFENICSQHIYFFQKH